MLGAIVLIVGGGWCAVIVWQASGPLRTLVVAVAYVAAFGVSHPLGKAIGTWPAVIGVAMASALVAYVAMRPGSRRVSATTPPTDSMK